MRKIFNMHSDRSVELVTTEIEPHAARQSHRVWQVPELRGLDNTRSGTHDCLFVCESDYNKVPLAEITCNL